jgi:Zn ribbon nucleic-acid-binding protein
MTKKMTNKKYLEAAGALCPYCRSSKISANGYPEPEGREATGRVDCSGCGKSWYEVWKLAGWFEC